MMPKPDWDEGEPVEARPGAARKSALQLAIGFGVLAIVLVGILLGGAALVGGYLPPRDSSEPYCNPLTDRCSNTFNLAGVETQTGYTFPDGSLLLESSTRGGSLRYPQERSLSATVQMPPGSALPTTADPLSSIEVTGTDPEGAITVQVRTSNGEGPSAG